MVRRLFILIMSLILAVLIPGIYFNNKQLELNYIGIEKLNAASIDKQIDKIKLSYYSDNIVKITNAIKQISLVEYANVQSCSFFSFKCYLVEISEAKASFLIHESDTNKDYYFSASGKQIHDSIKDSKTENLNTYIKKKDFVKFVTVEKLTSFYLYDANINYILYVLNIFHKSRIKILRVELIGKKLQKVFIDGLDFPVIFSFKSSDKKLLIKELERLKVILKDLEGNYSDIVAINLSYGRVGSVIYSNNISNSKK